jgi:Ca2+-binding RTX toxin-like protein
MATYKNVEEKKTYEYFTDKEMVLSGISWTKSNGSTSTANELYLKNVSSSGTQIDNPNIYYDGGAGTDKLTYSGTKGVTATVWGDEAGEDALYGKDYDFYLVGGVRKDTSSTHSGIDKMEVWTVNVEEFNLTSEKDSVDLTGLRSGVDTTWVAEGGNDVLIGSGNNERFYGGDDKDWLKGAAGADYLDGGAHDDSIYGGNDDDTVMGGSGNDLLYGGNDEDEVYGGSGNDRLYGGSGDDTLDGGTGNDVLNGNSGDDVLDGNDGDNYVAGGSGHDVIYTTTDLTGSEQNYVAGDMTVVSEEDGTGTFVAASGYNESDVFVIGYETTGTVSQADSGFGDFFSSQGGTAVVETGAKILTSAVGASWAGPLVEFGINSMIGAIKGGSAAKSLYTTVESITAQVTIQDFDAWSDTVVVALDSHASMVTGGAATNANAQAQLAINMQGGTFLSIVGDQLTASAMDGAFEDASYTIALENSEMLSILQNVYNNGVRVWTDDGVLSAKTLNGVDLLLDDDASQLTDLADDIGDNDGVLLLGNVGGGTIYGNSLSAVAGSNSDDVIYAGTYASKDYGAAFSSNTNINAYAGDGDDTVFGSTQSGDRLFGGKGDDYLHIGGTSGEEIDKIFGGEDFDVAGFGNISGVTNRTSGLTVDLGATSAATADYVGAKYATATWNDSGAIAAELYDVEGIDGTDAADAITGSGEANILWGNGGADTISGQGGADTISGGAGDDLLSGGSGADTFVFGAADGSDTITDFSAGDSIELTGGAPDSYSFSSGNGGTTISFHDTSIFLADMEGSADDFTITQDGDNLRLTLSGGSDSSGGSSNPGDTVICTYMHARGLIRDEVYAWDAVYGARLGEDVLRGYHFWAVPLVEHVLKKSEIATWIVQPLACAWAAEMAHRCAPLAHPRGRLLGKVLLATGVPLCRMIGQMLVRKRPEIWPVRR